MARQETTIQIEPGSELDHLLESVTSAEVFLERNGARYRLQRVAASEGVRWPQQPRSPERIREIIGLGESAEGSDIAHDKHRYLADAADDREV